ncbi:Zinc finger, C2H2 [Cynara cardunculus var. scolymus]|uniref:Zinc finger, C2H2 n=1 Tax=Cynara cardunculus var. scolymus TaxID=59895 RepID=A0A103XUI3_CYNCS|nr:Zinc finger, C2H2 [Cynara cardunculus var. scolymus]
MASADDQQTNFKHFCRICKKGFMCGRALGGHMRAHGIGDDTGNLDDEDPVSDWEDKQGNKRMYALRTNPNRLKSCRVCENCGKEFLSWKSEDEDLALAKCLMELSNARVDPVELTDVEDSCASPSREEQRRNPMFTKPAFLTSPFTRPPPPLDHKAKGIATTPKGMFECKACKKVFNSHQALGGHRASHKKVKGCFAARNDQFADDSIGDDDVITHDEFFPSPKPISSYQFSQGPSSTMPPAPAPLVGAPRRKSRVHKCSICNRIFASGQALGGHKRCHWLTSNMSDTSSLAKFNFHEHIEQLHRRALALPSQILNKSKALDLNLPAPADDIAGLRRDPRYPLSFEVSTEINLHSWNVDHENGTDGDGKDQNNRTGDQQDDRKNTSNHEKEAAAGGGGGGATMEDDEADSKVKLAKLSELKDMKNISGSSSSWLQVGIGTSTTDVGPSGPSHDT